MAKHLTSEGHPAFTYTQEVTVDLPPVDQEARFLVRRSDWERIKRQLELLRADNQIWSKLAIALFTLSVSTLLSAFTLIPYATNLPDWVSAVWWCVGVAGGVGAGLCTIFHHRTKSTRAQDISGILSEMEQLEPVSWEMEETMESESISLSPSPN